MIKSAYDSARQYRTLDGWIARYLAENPSPCRNCTERHVGCHSDCDKEIAFKRTMEIEKHKVWESMGNNETTFYQTKTHYERKDKKLRSREESDDWKNTNHSRI